MRFMLNRRDKIYCRLTRLGVLELPRDAVKPAVLAEKRTCLFEIEGHAVRFAL